MTPPVMMHGRERRESRGATAMGPWANTTPLVPRAHAFAFAGVPPATMMHVMPAFGPKVDSLRMQSAMTKRLDAQDGGRVAAMMRAPFAPVAAFGVAPMPPARPVGVAPPVRTTTKSLSASDGSHNTTHLDGDGEDAPAIEDCASTERLTQRQDAHFSGLFGAGHGLAVMIPQTSFDQVPLALRNARLNALAIPDRSQTPGVKSPFSAANVLLNMMACGSDEENEAPGTRGNKRDSLHPLSVPCPKKRRTSKSLRARSNLNTLNVDAKPEAAAEAHASGKPKAHRPWSLPEVEALVRGVAHYGRGQWADIKALRLDGVSETLINRSAVDLKDKWRNLLRVAVLPALYKRREINGVPAEILERVRVLASAKVEARVGKHGAPRDAVGEGMSVATVKMSSPGQSDADKTEDDAGAKGVRRSKHHSPWTMKEAMALVDGVDRCGGCRWTVIKKSDDPALGRRTAMDLKDKWRNLLQLASLPPQSRRKQETPADFLQRVLDLEAKYGGARRKGRKPVNKMAQA